MAKSGRFTMPKIAAPLGSATSPDDARRKPGPMAVAGRESAEAVTRIVEEQTEQRRRNAEDAEAWREARSDGLVLVRLPIDRVNADSLPRDRMALEAVAASEEMEELKASIRARGQREAIEVFEAEPGVYQLKSGWRRLEALRQLLAETGDARFGRVVAKIDGSGGDRIGLYVGMVEENAIREDVSFAEMAHVALAMAQDALTPVETAEQAVSLLYGALNKVKRSNIRRFVDLLEMVGDVLPEPRAVPKNLGAEAARILAADCGRLAALREALERAGTAEAQNAALQALVEQRQGARGDGGGAGPSRGRVDARQKYEFHHAEMKVTARRGEVRIKGRKDFASMPREKLEAAVAAFRAALED